MWGKSKKGNSFCVQHACLTLTHAGLVSPAQYFIPYNIIIMQALSLSDIDPSDHLSLPFSVEETLEVSV